MKFGVADNDMKDIKATIEAELTARGYTDIDVTGASIVEGISSKLYLITKQ